ncbi:RNA-dependent RNA polymerase [Salix suchowensis]|nr:RNA-dependent RNA polymerase [Salix suchowensis]
MNLEVDLSDVDIKTISDVPCQLLENFKQMEPWTPPTSTPNVPNRKPSVFSDEELEVELFKLFLRNRFQPGCSKERWKKDVWKHPCFDDEVRESYLEKWQNLYGQYRKEMSNALKADPENKDRKANEVIKKYKEEIFEEARALYQVT